MEDRVRERPDDLAGKTPPAGEARGGMPWQTWAAILLAAGLVVAGIALLLVSACGSRRPKPYAPRRAAQPADYGALHNRTLGAAEARVEVLVVVPLNVDCHAPTIEYIRKVSEQCPRHVRARFLELRSAEGKSALKSASKDFCATLFINGRWNVRGAEERACRLTGPLGSDYTLADVRAALLEEVTRVYGSEAPALPMPGGSDAPVSPSLPAEGRAGAR